MISGVYNRKSNGISSSCEKALGVGNKRLNELVHEKPNKYNNKFYGVYSRIVSEEMPVEGRLAWEGLIEPDLLYKLKFSDFESFVSEVGKTFSKEKSFLIVAPVREKLGRTATYFYSYGIPVFYCLYNNTRTVYFSTEKELVEKVSSILDTNPRVEELGPYAAMRTTGPEIVDLTVEASSDSAILFSGGILSMAMAHNVRRLGTGVKLLHIFSREDFRKVKRLADTLRMPLDYVQQSVVVNNLVEENKSKDKILHCDDRISWPALAASWAVQDRISNIWSADRDITLAGNSIGILAPEGHRLKFNNFLAGMTDSRVLQYCKEHKLPIELCHSCLTYSDGSCGHCSKCISWKKAFSDAGMKDPRLLV